MVEDSFINPHIRAEFFGEELIIPENSVTLKRAIIPQGFWRILIIITIFFTIAGTIFGIILTGGAYIGFDGLIAGIIGIIISIIVARFMPAVRLTAPISFFTNNPTIGLEFVDVSNKKSIYKRDGLKWNVEGKIKRNKGELVISETQVVLYIRTPRYPRIKKDIEYSVNVTVDSGGFTNNLVFTNPTGKRNFAFQGF